MLDFLKKLFASKPTVNPCPEAPYKVETPTPVAETPAPVLTEDKAEWPFPATEQSKKQPAKKKASTKKAAPKQSGQKAKVKSKTKS